MTNELYLHTLRQLRDGCRAEHMDTETAALEAAIQALSGDGDCVSRKAAREALCDNCDNVQAVCPHYPCKQYTAIEELPSAQPEQQWIPCSEPPKESETYIVTAYDGTDKRVTFVKYQKTLKRWDLTGARAYWRILAYKPLPEPWRGANS